MSKGSDGLLNIIKTRRSVRRYKKGIPSQDVINKILEAGRWAPSGLNNQPWRFMVIKDLDSRQGLARFTKYGSIIITAPVVIAVFMDNAASYHREKDLMAMGACIENMLLQAHASGLGCCWLGEILNKKHLAACFLKQSPPLELAAVLTLGYPLSAHPRSSRKTPRSLMLK